MLEGEGDGAIGSDEGGQLHGRDGDGRRARAVEQEQRGRGAAGGQEEEEEGHDAGRRGGGRAVAGARGRVVLRRQPRRRSGHGRRPGRANLAGVLGGGGCR
ncbi:hypothetical protein PVAP13_6NG223103 [Panicum virgatum]|uniref:Uncharacterized protein n=1 Tax=Panicum virgatum TaxID=38727 RepID=A0A8T0QZB8_PANVG|nr:hypothetical protein PVAP13_6NG223103 [Panicum virgatum]